MIIRIFRVQIYPELRADFERDFNTISVEAVKSHKTSLSCEIGYPTQWNPDEYTMITKWEKEEDLVAFVGENWNVSVILSRRICNPTTEWSIRICDPAK